MDIRSKYDEHDPNLYGIAIDPEENMAMQEFEAECNINNIMAKYQKTGTIDHIAKYSPFYGDVQAITYDEALNTIMSAENMFNDLPSKLREHFENNPSKFLAFVERDGIDGVYDKLEELGEIYGKGSRYEPAPPQPVVDPAPADPSAPTGDPANG